MNEILLSPRLRAVSKFIEPGAKVADVGTDHGYLPVWLALTGMAERIAATDVKRGPLRSAEASAARYGVTDKIEFSLTDGLDGLECGGYDTIVMAGMGGETIIAILEKAPRVRAGVRLILQPQTKLDELTDWLSLNGYGVSDAVLVRDAGRLYTVLAVSWPAIDKNADVIEHLRRNEDPLLAEYAASRLTSLKRELTGLRIALNTDTARIALLEEKIRRFESL